jgi:hypothetical protein
VMDDTLVSVSALERYFGDCTAPEIEMLCANVLILAQRKYESDREQWRSELREFYSQFADEALRLI